MVTLAVRMRTAATAAGRTGDVEYGDDGGGGGSMVECRDAFALAMKAAPQERKRVEGGGVIFGYRGSLVYP